MPTGADVPSIYDVVINAQGYLVADTEQIQAQMGSAPLFSPPNYLRSESDVDPQNEWFMALVCDDWTGGEGQRKYDPKVQGSSSMFWRNTNTDVQRRNRVTLAQASGSSTVAAGLIALCKRGDLGNGSQFCYVNTTNLYTIDLAGTITDRGAHGAGTPSGWTSLCSDSTYDYIAGNGGIRKWNGSAFSTFAAVAVTSICYWNDYIYATRGSNGDLLRFDRATGEVTLIKKWLMGDGNAINTGFSSFAPTPEGIYISVPYQETGSQVWFYDGNPQLETKMVADLPDNFYANNLVSCNGTIYAIGAFHRTGNLTTYYRSAILACKNGSYRTAWLDDDWIGQGGGFAGGTSWENGIVFVNLARGLMFFDPETENVRTFASYSTNGAQPLIATNLDGILYGETSLTTVTRWPTNAYAATGTLDTSLYDFGSPLAKRFHSVEVEFDAATGGGGSVSVSYQLETTEGSWTSLGVVTTGTPVAISQVGRSIAIRLTIAKGTTGTPAVRKVTLRALPYQALQRSETYVLNLSGRDGTRPLVLRNGATHTKDGLDMATDLRTAAASNAPISITDEFGTFNGYIDASALEFRRIRSQEYVAVVKIREVV
jgi:hypothetical protein